MSRWTHSICDMCWHEREGDREPYRAIGEALDWDDCCFCGGDHLSGICYRMDPNDPVLLCAGIHDDDP